MQWPVIHKVWEQDTDAAPNLRNYAETRRTFSWERARADLITGNESSLNIANLAVDRHVLQGRGDKQAIRWLNKTGDVVDFTYSTLARESNRFANVLTKAGIVKGDCVFTLLGRRPELYLAALATLKCGAIFSPLFSVFGPEPIRIRIVRGEGKALVTTTELYKRKIAPYRDQLPGLKVVFLVDDDHRPDATDYLGEAMAAASDRFDIVQTRPEDPALLHFTSGTTGTPKGAVHVHEAVIAHYITGKYALDLHNDDIFWCTADPGWVTGTSYGIIAPLVLGVAMIVDEAEFDPERWYTILREQKVSVWYTAPTAIRMLMRAGTGLIKPGTFDSVRFMASVGEPLNPEAVIWSNEKLGLPFHDNWWQTETGGIMIANFRSLDIKPGSMGLPLPGVDAGIVERRSDGTLNEITVPNAQGELALKRGWPSMFRGYLHDEARYQKNFVGDWYLTGDLATRDEDGYFWFVGRSDDVIKSAGHLIGPFEVESALLEHPALSEAAVIGIPDPVAGETVKAYVTLNSGFEESEELRNEILGYARRRLGPAVAPKEIVFRDSLPRTRSGKIMRRLLKARELGLPEGDISTLESDEK